MPARSLAAYTILGLVQSAVIAVCLWLSLRRNAIAATVAALFFVALSMCGASTWGANFLFPYSYAATLGMMFVVMALAAVLNGRVPVALTALFLASWCKVEYAAGVALIVVVLAITRRVTLRQVAVFAGAWLLSLAVVVRMFPEMNLFGLTNASARHFFAVVAGRPAWDHLLALLGILAVAWLLRRSRWWLAILLMVPLAYHGFFRAWFFLQLALLAYALVKERRSPSSPSSPSPRRCASRSTSRRRGTASSSSCRFTRSSPTFSSSGGRRRRGSCSWPCSARAICGSSTSAGA